MKLIRWLVIICVFLLLVYGASPYFSFWRFTAAVQSRDAAAISSRVDFPAVRASLKKQLVARFANNAPSHKRWSNLGPTLIDAIVDDYLPLLDIISERMDDLEDSIFGEWRAVVIEEIFMIKKKLLYLRRAITPLRDVFNTLLRREQPIFPRETHVYFQDVFDHLIRVADNIDTLRDMLSSTMDAYLSVSGNRMNKVMKRLTSVSTILMSVTLIAGIYGMNFVFMPELRWRYGYVFALLSIVVVALALYAYLKKVDWL